MLLHKHDQDAFKLWVLPKLETISDADAEVLADYVSALVGSQDSAANVKRNCLAPLSDFLQDHTETFLGDVVKALEERSYVVDAVMTAKTPAASVGPDTKETLLSPPVAAVVSDSKEATRAPHDMPAVPQGPAAPQATKELHTQSTQQSTLTSSRKRKLVDCEPNHPIEVHAPQDDRNTGNKRVMRQTARKGGSQACGRPREPLASYGTPRAMPNFWGFPPPPPGPLPFDPLDPMAMFAMAAAFGVDLSGMPPLPFVAPQNNGRRAKGPKEQCKSYHTQGFCMLGAACPFEHGKAIAFSPNGVPPYDPEHASLALQSNGQRGANGEPQGKLLNNKGGQPRAPFTLVGPSYDLSNTTLVVDKIPEKHFSEDNVRGFFSEFGDIADVQMHTHKGIAVIKFQDREAAERAYNSPKAVFDNRFVRVFWHKSKSQSEPSYEDMGSSNEGQQDEREDPEVIAKRQAEAQQAFEERRRRAEEAAVRSAEIERQLKEKTEEMRKIQHQLAELSGDKSGEEEGFTQTLAELQAEAEDLFAQYEPEAEPYDRGHGAFRGGYQGRGHGSFTPRREGHSSSVSMDRGRDVGFSSTRGRASVKRLDNRPRRLAVADVEEHSTKDDALRQHLINMADYVSIERHPEQINTLILSFNERYQAEMFLDNSRSLSGVGKLDLSWLPNDASSQLKIARTDEEADVGEDGSSATVAEEDGKAEVPVKAEYEDAREEADMDVADDVDQWLTV